MKLTGHKTRAVFERYNVTSGSDLERAAQQLNAYHSAKAGARRTVEARLARV